jgi:hypothetical protein
MQTQLTYRNNNYAIRQNALGVGSEIAKLAAAYEDELLLARYHVVKLPDYGRYQMIMHSISQIGLDFREQSEKLKKAKGAEKTRLAKIVATGKKGLDAEFKLLEEPAINVIATRIDSITREVYFGFTNNTDNLKALCDALLIGDTSLIKYDEPDSDLLALRDTVFEVFFSIKSSIYK